MKELEREEELQNEVSNIIFRGNEYSKTKLMNKS
jgi:hypothetical protein